MDSNEWPVTQIRDALSDALEKLDAVQRLAAEFGDLYDDPRIRGLGRRITEAIETVPEIDDFGLQHDLDVESEAILTYHRVDCDAQ